MHGFESFFVSEPDGSAKTVISRHSTIAGSWIVGPHTVTTDELHGMREAAEAALAQNVSGRFSSKVYDTWAGPDVIFAPNARESQADDTVQLGSLPPWTRTKAEAFIAAVPVYVPLPPAP